MTTTRCFNGYKANEEEEFSEFGHPRGVRRFFISAPN